MQEPIRTVLIVLVAASLLTAPVRAARTPPRVIPWLDQRPVKASAHPPLAPACKAAKLKSRLFLQGATGSLVGGIDLTNIGRHPCSLVGRPHLSFVGPAARRTRWHVVQIARSPVPVDVVQDPPGSLRALASGKTAAVALYWSNWCGPDSRPASGPGPPPTAIKLALPSQTSISFPVASAPRCDNPHAPSRLAVEPFTPAVRQSPPSSRLPLRAAIVGVGPVKVKPGVRAFRVRRGSVFRYRVAVTNIAKRSFRFGGCPVYIEQLVPSVPQQAYVLNCRSVRSIAPHKRVIFLMRLRVPKRAHLGVNGLTWELAPTTYLAPHASGAVLIVP